LEKPFGTFEEMNREELIRPIIYMIDSTEIAIRTPEKAQYSEILV